MKNVYKKKQWYYTTTVVDSPPFHLFVSFKFFRKRALSPKETSLSERILKNVDKGGS